MRYSVETREHGSLKTYHEFTGLGDAIDYVEKAVLHDCLYISAARIVGDIIRIEYSPLVIFITPL